MAGRPDYRSGSITLTSGSTDFTTTGAALQAASIQTGDSVLTQGLMLPIATITGQNSGTLADPCPAAAAGTHDLVVRYQADGSRLSAMTQQLVGMLGNGNVAALAALLGAPDKLPIFVGPGAMELIDKTAVGLQDPTGALAAIAALTPAANKLAYFSGDETAALTDLTAFARTLLAGGSAAAMRSTLGVGQFEEGTWTPALGSIKTVDYSAATSVTGTGTYRRMGKLVIVDCNFTVQGVPSASITSLMSLSLTGLPYVPGGSGSMAFDQAGVTGAVYRSIGAPQCNIIGGGFADAGSGTMYLLMLPSSSGANANVQDNHYVTGIYNIP